MDEEIYSDWLSPEQNAYRQFQMRNWFTPGSGFDVTNQDLLNYFARLDQRSKPQAFIEDNAVGMLGSLGYGIHPVAGIAGGALGLVEDAANAKRDYAWNVYKQAYNNALAEGRPRVTQEEYDRLYNAQREREAMASDVAMAAITEAATALLSTTAPGLNTLRNFGKAVVRSGASELTSEAAQNAARRLREMNYGSEWD